MNKRCSEIAEMLGITFDNSYEDKYVTGVCFDSRKIKEGDLFIPLIGERVNGHQYGQQVADQKASCILWNEDEENVPSGICVLKVKDTQQAFSDLAKAYRKACGFKIIGITGSNGKTSTKDLIAGVLSSKFKVQKTSGNHNNEIGVPYTLLSFDEDIDVGVVEMGMENLKEIEELCKIVVPDIGIVTNVGTAHMENLGSQANIAKAKCEMIDGLAKDGVFFYNGDDSFLVEEVKNHELPTLVQTFGESENNDCQLTRYEQSDSGIVFDTNLLAGIQAPVLGKHQAMNGCAALLCAKYLGLSDEEILRGFMLTEATKWRTQLEMIGNCRVLNDVYKSNPQSACAALETFEGFKSPRKIIVFGDMFDLGPNEAQIHFDLGKLLGNIRVICYTVLVSFLVILHLAQNLWE